MKTILVLLLALPIFGQVPNPKLIYVAKLGTAPGAEKARDLLLTALASGGFRVTEDESRADATMVGYAEEKILKRASAIDGAGLFPAQLDAGDVVQATLSVRLLDKNKDVVWAFSNATTKCRGPIAKCVVDELKKATGGK